MQFGPIETVRPGYFGPSPVPTGITLVTLPNMLITGNGVSYSSAAEVWNLLEAPSAM